MAWTDFEVTVEQVAAKDPTLNLTADKVLDFIDQAQSNIEDKLKLLIYRRYKDAKKPLLADLPDPVLDAILSEGFPQIRKMVIYHTLEMVYIKDNIEMSSYWKSQYDAQPMDEIRVDIDQDSVLDEEEFKITQDDLDNTMVR